MALTNPNSAINVERLSYFRQKLNGDIATSLNAKVDKELKTGSTTAYKVLSDNNLTDALLQKINDAGTSSFNGSYTKLTDKPSIEGHEVVSGDQTAASLGLATSGQITTLDGKFASYYTKTVADTTFLKKTDAYSLPIASSATLGGVMVFIDDPANDSGKYEHAAAAVDKTGELQIRVAKPGDTGIVTISASDTSGLSLDNDGVLSLASVPQTSLAAALSTKIDNAQTASQVKAAIDSALTSAIIPKGSSTFINLPIPAKGNLGWMYNVTDAFTSTTSFVEGAGKSYPAGSNVVCVLVGTDYRWDVQGGFVDLSNYQTKLTWATDADIDSIFS
nr:MAG TPA: hypothetical protein [Caudoviricetes sp.]